MRAAEARQERAQGPEVQPGQVQVQEPERAQAAPRGPEVQPGQVQERAQAALRGPEPGVQQARGSRVLAARRCPEWR